MKSSAAAQLIKYEVRLSIKEGPVGHAFLFISYVRHSACTWLLRGTCFSAHSQMLLGEREARQFRAASAVSYGKIMWLDFHLRQRKILIGKAMQKRVHSEQALWEWQIKSKPSISAGFNWNHLQCCRFGISVFLVFCFLVVSMSFLLLHCLLEAPPIECSSWWFNENRKIIFWFGAVSMQR